MGLLGSGVSWALTLLGDEPQMEEVSLFPELMSSVCIPASLQFGGHVPLQSTHRALGTQSPWGGSSCTTQRPGKQAWSKQSDAWWSSLC